MMIASDFRNGMGVMGLAAALSLASFALPDLAKADVRANPPGSCLRTLKADIVAIDMPLMWNRLGAQNVNGMMYALKRDVINLTDNKPLTKGGAATPGYVALRPDKRPRPLVLHSGKGDCLEITLTNLLTKDANPFNAGIERSKIPFNILDNEAVAERRIGLRFQGTPIRLKERGRLGIGGGGQERRRERQGQLHADCPSDRLTLRFSDPPTVRPSHRARSSTSRA